MTYSIFAKNTKPKMGSSVLAKHAGVCTASYNKPVPGPLLNWGCTKSPVWLGDQLVINHFKNINNAVNKLWTLQCLHEAEIECLRYTQDIEQAKKWILDGYRVFCRTLLTSSKAKGIVVAATMDELVPCKLYTREYKKTHEYRIHVDRINDRSLVTQKRKKLGNPKDNTIRNLENGWIFSTNLTKFDERMVFESFSAVAALGLDFGAVDMLAVFAKDQTNTAKSFVVCEVNTAPALKKPATMDFYKGFFK